ncbi:hypothetical protein [Mycolicibacterium arenosum]|uniref:Scaffolding protein n=1 Tax=Mycolicibacterium arenosum TaxID=2952157 RepID=A0ABT1M2D4_9MYCO|nr:hypothetical protein [Mycolicibacterium sp. CAU 1645]MCP9272775.1 hypothetical protein [Mycolicibacterium sp. CAU 1645]
MTDDNTTPDAESTDVTTEPGTPVDGPDGPVEAPEADESLDGAEEQDGGNREAAKYRRRLRDAEAERDTLRTRLETLQRTEAERLAGRHLAKGAALWVGGTELAELLDANGDVDPAKVTERAQHVRDEYGVEQPRKGPYVAREGENPSPRHTGGMLDVVMGRRP